MVREACLDVRVGYLDAYRELCFRSHSCTAADRPVLDRGGQLERIYCSTFDVCTCKPHPRTSSNDRCGVRCFWTGYALQTDHDGTYAAYRISVTAGLHTWLVHRRCVRACLVWLPLLHDVSLYIELLRF